MFFHPLIYSLIFFNSRLSGIEHVHVEETDITGKSKSKNVITICDVSHQGE
jgi:hypothetical protein